MTQIWQKSFASVVLCWCFQAGVSSTQSPLALEKSFSKDSCRAVFVAAWGLVFREENPCSQIASRARACQQHSPDLSCSPSCARGNAALQAAHHDIIWAMPCHLRAICLSLQWRWQLHAWGNLQAVSLESQVSTALAAEHYSRNARLLQGGSQSLGWGSGLPHGPGDRKIIHEEIRHNPSMF